MRSHLLFELGLLYTDFAIKANVRLVQDLNGEGYTIGHLVTNKSIALGDTLFVLVNFDFGCSINVFINYTSSGCGARVEGRACQRCVMHASDARARAQRKTDFLK